VLGLCLDNLRTTNGGALTPASMADWHSKKDNPARQHSKSLYETRPKVSDDFTIPGLDYTLLSKLLKRHRKFLTVIHRKGWPVKNENN
jgi:hypothetical protein